MFVCKARPSFAQCTAAQLLLLNEKKSETIYFYCLRFESFFFK